ncbi:glutamine synthetase family protein [Streptomyces sp. NBC_00989]|uniref:glutamine synthetase family protein n=1 Tax=Streptomyces sp. NBC_00989 TaxID=2903705 RepID=UPI00386ABC54|nr:glutamine synthetase family protein [Streptomyces sp. NBC_00989]
MATGKTVRPATLWPSGAVSGEALRELVEARRITEVMLALPDMQGCLKGKVFSASVFLERMAGGAEMCSYLLATDTGMTPLDGFELTGWTQGFGDFLVTPDLSTGRVLPTRPGTVIVIGDPVQHDGTPVQVDPRHMLRTQLDGMRELGYEVRVGVESEFVLHSDGESGLVPAWSGNLDYALDLPLAATSFARHLSGALADAGIAYEAFKTEGAPGQAEVTFPYGDVLGACDHYALFRLLARDVAGYDGLVPAFMAAPQTGTGSGLHLHLSLWNEHGDPGFDHHRGQDLPPLMTHAIAGLISALPHLAPLYWPNPNSYKRLRPHSFAPTRYNWGIDHRGCAVRVTGHGRGARLEVRLAGSDANAYLALTAYIAAMAHGIEEKLEPRPACEGDAYQDTSTIPVYADLADALQHFEHSTAAHHLLGKDVVGHYAHAARADLDWHRRHVTDTERRRGIR